MKIQRNAPCPCGSGKKYKACCLKTGLRFGEEIAEDPRLIKLIEISNKIKSELLWEIKIEPIDSWMSSITSSISEKKHTIHVARKTEGYLRLALDFIHELIHAKLCEQVHVFFSSIHFVENADMNLSESIAPIINTAIDWFVEAQVAALCPDEMRQSLASDLKLSSNDTLDKQLTIDTVYARALIAACGIKWGNFEIELGGDYKRIVDTLMTIPPESPSIDNLLLLMNRLLELFTNYSVHVVRQYKMDLLEIR